MRSSSRGLASPTAGAAAAMSALSPTEVAAEERRRNAERGHHGSLWLGGCACGAGLLLPWA